jgi:protein tyrosine/serine phosphatase
LKTIINLRGYNPTQGRYQLEAKACEEAGITLINTRVHSRGLPTAKQINLLKELIEGFETPALAHCKSGADRAGIFAVLYCHFRLDQPIDEAKEQLHWTYGHFRSAKTGILDHFFESYIHYRDQRKENHPSESAPTFLEWVNTEYDRDAMEKEFKPRGFANFWVDWVLRRE